MNKHGEILEGLKLGRVQECGTEDFDGYPQNKAVKSAAENAVKKPYDSDEKAMVSKLKELNYNDWTVAAIIDGLRRSGEKGIEKIMSKEFEFPRAKVTKVTKILAELEKEGITW